MDDAAGPTVWMPADLNGGTASVEHTMEALLRDFPYMDQTGTSLGALGKVFDDFGDGTILDTRTVSRLADWLEGYLETTQNMSRQWFDLHTVAREFWESLPKVIHSVAVRR